MQFAQRLKTLRLERDLTQKALGKIVGVSTVAVQCWERGEKKPSMDAIISLSKALKVSVDSLLGLSIEMQDHALVLTKGEKKLLADYRTLDNYGRKAVRTICAIEKERMAETASVQPTKIEDIRQFKSRERYIPRYMTPSAAGINVPLDGAEFEMILVDDSVPEDADYAVDIQGNSMAPYIHDGDMVFVKKDAELSVGDVGIFCVDGAMYCKQYYLADDGTLILASANQKLRHTNIVLSPESDSSVRVCGKVLMNQRVELPDYLSEN